MALCQTSVLKIYHTVIEDVIANVRDAFLDEGVDEQVLQEMKSIWRNKLMSSKAVELAIEPAEPQIPPIVANNQKSVVAKAKKTAVGILAAAPSAIATTSAGEARTTTRTSHLNGNSKNETSNHMPLSSNPPPLTPTSQATLLTQHRSTAASSNSSTNNTQSNAPAVAAIEPNRIMPVNITLPVQAGSANSEQRVLTIHVPASALQENQLTQILTAHLISSIMSLPTTLASSVLQQHVNAALMQKNIGSAKQIDGALDTSDEDDSDESDDNMENDDEDDADKDDDMDEENEGPEEEPLNSEDDVTDEDASDLFDTDNVIVCQYDKITRSRNKWKFYLKDGIMNIGGKDYVFQKSHGDAEW